VPILPDPGLHVPAFAEPHGQQVDAGGRVGRPAAQAYPQLGAQALSGLDDRCRFRTAGFVRGLLGSCAQGALGQPPDLLTVSSSDSAASSVHPAFVCVASARAVVGGGRS
jgi:hypothetical protein